MGVYYRCRRDFADENTSPTRAERGIIMLYTIIITDENETKTTHHIAAKNISDAHVKGEKLTAKGDTLKVYATTQEPNGDIIVEGLSDGALTVVKRTTANMINREGGDIQYRLYNECRRPIISDSDILDCLSVATLAMIEAIREGEPIEKQYSAAYLALNKHLRDNRQINLSATAQRTLYIEDINGDIINVNSEINRILKPGEGYAPMDDIDNTSGNYNRRVIKTIAKDLTPIQLTVLAYLSKGYTVRQIAEKMNRSAPTIQVHINKIREKANTLYPNGYKA